MALFVAQLGNSVTQNVSETGGNERNNMVWTALIKREKRTSEFIY